MKKTLFTIIICLLVFQAFSKASSLQDSLKNFYQRNQELKEELAKTKAEIEYTKSLVQTGNGVISNQLSSSQHSLSSLSTLFTVIGIILAVLIPFGGWYVTWLSRQVTKKLEEANIILNSITILKAEVQAIETDVNNTRDLIHSNLSGLYQSLQDEEIKAIFRHLKIEPLDVQHSFTKLTMSKLSDEYFSDLKEIYFKTKGKHTNAAAYAMALLVQHYPTKCFNDLKFVDEISGYYVSDGLYISEIPAYHDALCNFITDKEISKYNLLFKNSLIGIEKKLDFTTCAESVLSIWNSKLNEQHKLFIINLINSDPLLISFRHKLKNWNSFIYIK